jgi:uncharacterized protein YjcR
MQKKATASTVLSRRLKKRAVAVALNGKIRLPILARKLRVSLKQLKRWKRRFGEKIQKRQLPAKKARKHLKLLLALSQRAQAQARVIKLKAALRGV